MCYEAKLGYNMQAALVQVIKSKKAAALRFAAMNAQQRKAREGTIHLMSDWI